MIDNYKDLKIGKYLEILEDCKAGGDELETQVTLIAALSGKTETEILNMPISEYSALARSASFLTKAPELPEKPAKVYEVGGFRLVPVMDAGKITTAQYIDFQTLAKHKEGKVVEILSCLLVPEGKRYNEGYDIADVHKAIQEDMSVADAMGEYAFFRLMQEVNTGYPVLFGRQGGEEENSADGEGGDDEVDSEGGAFGVKWDWLAWVDMVSNTCRCSWDDVFRKSAVEFLNIVCYSRDKAEEEKRNIERWKRRH